MGLTLVVLAAGLGSRFGASKQTVPVGPGGAWLLDYTVFDAIRAGFERIVLVIRPELEPAFRDRFDRLLRRRIEVGYATQRLDSPKAGPAAAAGRTKPWGTAHAVLAAADLVDDPFAVANADDFYGAAAFACAACFLREGARSAPPTYAIVAFPLAHTLSDTGPVNRALCSSTEDGWLTDIHEVLGIVPLGAGGAYHDQAEGQHVLRGDALVSMNLWCFTPGVFPPLQAAFNAFLSTLERPALDELLLAPVVQHLVDTGQARVKLLPTSSRWSGITHPADRERVAAMVAKGVACGEYPDPLWT